MNNLPYNLSLYTAACAITNFNNTTTYKTLVSGATGGTSGIFYGGATSDPTDGIIDIVLIGTDITAFTFTNARYKLIMTPTGVGQPIWLMYGVFTVIS